MLGTIVRIIACLPPFLQGNIPESLIDALYHHPVCRKNTSVELQSVVDKESSGVPDKMSRDQFNSLFESFRQKYISWERYFKLFMSKIADGVSFSHRWVEETRSELENSIELRCIFRYMDDSDSESCYDFLLKLLNTAEKYCSAESFGNREECLNSTVDWITERKRWIVDSPRHYSYECLQNVLDAMHDVAKQELGFLYVNNPPKLICEIAGDRLKVDGGFADVQLRIANERNRQTGDNVIIRIVDDETGIYETLQAESSPLRRVKSGEDIYCTERIKIKQEIKSFDIHVNISYEYRGEDGKGLSDTWTGGLPVFCVEAQEVGFEKLENPYSEYTETAAVNNRDMVFGRNELLNDIVTLLKGSKNNPLKRKALLLYGQKRTGKSTVLLHLEDDIRSDIPDAIIVKIGDLSSVPTGKGRFEAFFYSNVF